MTVETEYQQLVATGLWREAPDVQRREVTVTIGAETLILSDDQARALAHWSLPALLRANPGAYPAIYHPDGDPGETLELAESEAEMIRALDRLRSAIERRRPHPGRLRLILLMLMLAAVLTGGIFWLPDALRRHAVSVVPQGKRAEIGADLKEEITRVSGRPCDWAEGQDALNRLAARIAPQDRQLRQQPMMAEDYVCMVRPGHPVLDQAWTMDQYLGLDHLLVSSRQTGLGQVDFHLQQQLGKFRSIRLRVQHYLLAPSVLLRTDLAMSSPLGLAAQFDLPWLPLPFEMPPIRWHLHWHMSADQDQANIWLRDHIARVAGDVVAQA